MHCFVETLVLGHHKFLNAENIQLLQVLVVNILQFCVHIIFMQSQILLFLLSYWRYIEIWGWSSMGESRDSLATTKHRYAM